MKHCFPFLNKNVFYSWGHFFTSPRNLIALAIFFGKTVTKNIDMPRQKSGALVILTY